MKTIEKDTYCFECRILTDTVETESGKSICKNCGRLKKETTKSLQMKRKLFSIFLGFLFVLGWIGWGVVFVLLYRYVF
jgi:hypothetical protein